MCEARAHRPTFHVSLSSGRRYTYSYRGHLLSTIGINAILSKNSPRIVRWLASLSIFTQCGHGKLPHNRGLRTLFQFGTSRALGVYKVATASVSSTSIASSTNSMAPGKHSYLIVGAGVFGVSTAFHIIKTYPNAKVTIVDRDAFDAESRVAASWDWNKVVRADYDDVVYCRLGLEAQDIFRSDPLWKPFFHESGIYWMCRSDYAQDVVDNYKKLGRTADLAAVPIDEARKLYGGIFNEADYDGVKEVLVNKTSGWAAAGDCLRAITREAIRLGVKYVTADVASLNFDSSNRCTGILTKSGKSLSASHVILSTGAFTPKLLEQSAAKTGLDDLRAGDRILAAGITTGMTKLDEKSLETYASMPVGVQGYTAQTGTSSTPGSFVDIL